MKTVTVFSVKTNKINKGIYPFVIYQWKYSGECEDVLIKPISDDEKLNKCIVELLKIAKESNADVRINNNMWNDIDIYHHSLWQKELENYKEKTNEIVKYKLGTLTTSHRSRIKYIEDRIRRATNVKIRMMHEGHLRNAEADYQIRKKLLEQSAFKADIVFSALTYGILIIE